MPEGLKEDYEAFVCNAFCLHNYEIAYEITTTSLFHETVTTVLYDMDDLASGGGCDGGFHGAL